MKRRILWGLAALNLLLAVTLAARFTGDNTAVAQAPAGAAGVGGVRRPADYIMIPGEVNGGAGAVIYVIDTSNALLGALNYDDNQRQINTMPPIDLSRVFEVGPGSAPRGTRVAPGAVAPVR
jgi:hypothetical protein